MEERSKHNKDCLKCQEDFIWYEKEAWWDFKGSTDTKLIKCPYCGCVQPVKYIEQINPNIDKRYFG